MMSDLNRLRLLPLRVVATAREPFELPAFAGSALRGVFGRALRESVCVTGEPDCRICRLRGECAYPYLFETAPPPGARRLQKLPYVPHPYLVVAPDGPLRAAPGEGFTFALTLLGRATELFPLVAQAVLRAGELGLSATRARFQVTRIETCPGGDRAPVTLLEGEPPMLRGRTASALSSPAEFAADLRSGRARVTFVSPVRLVLKGSLAREVPFHLLVRSLLRRASSLLEFHEEIDLELDYLRLISDAERVQTVESTFILEDRVRYSARQGRTMNLQGVRGGVTYEGDLSRFQELLALGQAVGVGKGTTFGLGRFQVDAGRVPDESAWTSED